MKKRIILSALLCVGLGFPASGMAARYSVDLNRTTIDAFTGTGGMLSGLAHPHQIRAAKFKATIDYDSARPEETNIEILVDASSFALVDSNMDSDDDRTVTQNMMNILMPKEFPVVKFRARRVVASSTGLQVWGTFTLKGVSKKMLVRIALQEKEGTLTAKSEFVLKQSDFGIEPYSAALGMIQVSDAIRFEVRSVLLPVTGSEI